MSTNLAEKIQILRGLDEKHKDVLDALMADKGFKVPTLADRLGYQVSTVRNFLTDIYKVCGVPEGEEDKRGWIVREYSEAYLKMDVVIPPPSEPKKETPPPPTIEPRINVAPQAPRTNRSRIGLIVGLIVVSAITIGILYAIIQSLNSPKGGISESGSYSTSQKITLDVGVYLWGGFYGWAICDTNEDYWSQSLTVENSSGHDYDLSISHAKFSLVDSFGNSYELLSAKIMGDPTEDKDNRTIASGHSAGIMLCWLGRVSESGADYVNLKIMDLTNGGYDIVITNASP